eukprot:3589416-Rhodomonas_salina.2
MVRVGSSGMLVRTADVGRGLMMILLTIRESTEISARIQSGASSSPKHLKRWRTDRRYMVRNTAAMLVY